MKVNSLVALSSLLVLAAAQDSTNTASSTTTSLSPEASCAQNCASTDGCCVAQCYKVPCPSDDQANDTNKCVAACPQGTGTPEDTQKYISCQNACFTSHFFPATMTGVTVPSDISVVSATATGGASQTGSGASSTATETGSGSGGSGGSKSESTSSGSGSSGSSESGSASASGSASGTASGTGSASTETGAAVKVGASAAGLFGIVMAALAL